MTMDIIKNSDVPEMLDALLELRDGEWWDRFYGDRERGVPFFRNIPDASLAALCRSGRVPLGAALDVGCGNGRNTLFLAKQGFDATGIDISAEAIRWAQASAAELPVPPRFLCLPLSDLRAAPGSFTLINDSGCLHHIKPHRRPDYLARLAELLRPDGYLHLTCFNEEGGANITDLDVYRLCSMKGGLGFSEEKLRAVLSPWFEVVSLATMEEQTGTDYFSQPYLWTALLQKRPTSQP